MRYLILLILIAGCTRTTQIVTPEGQVVPPDPHWVYFINAGNRVEIDDESGKHEIKLPYNGVVISNKYLEELLER